jgi:hypothetical protein
MNTDSAKFCDSTNVCQTVCGHPVCGPGFIGMVVSESKFAGNYILGEYWLPECDCSTTCDDNNGSIVIF